MIGNVRFGNFFVKLSVVIILAVFVFNKRFIYFFNELWFEIVLIIIL